MRRLNDQVLVLQAIHEVRKELDNTTVNLELFEIMKRLSALYALLDVDRLAKVVSETDKRNHRKAG